MSIRFPKMHIAESVVNRILNASDDIEASQPSVSPPSMPNTPDIVPDPVAQGAGIDAKVEQPLAPVGEVTPDEIGSNSPEANTLEASLSGGTPLQGLLDGISVG